MATATVKSDELKSTNVMAYKTFLTYVVVKNGGNLSATAEQVVAILKENWSNLSANGLDDKTVVEYVGKWCAGDQIDRGRICTHQQCVEALEAGGFIVPESFVMPYTTFLTYVVQHLNDLSATAAQVVALLRKNWSNLSTVGLDDKTVVEYVGKWCAGDQIDRGRICTHQQCVEALRAGGFRVPESFVMPYTTFLTMLAPIPGGLDSSTPESVVAYLKDVAARQNKSDQNMIQIGLNNKTIVDYVNKFFHGDQVIDGPIFSRQECDKALRAGGVLV